VYENTMLDNVFRFLGAVGALNWGLVGLARFNLVRALFGENTFLTRVIYGLVGLAGAWAAYQLFTRVTRPTFEEMVQRRMSEVR